MLQKRFYQVVFEPGSNFMVCLCSEFSKSRPVFRNSNFEGLIVKPTKSVENVNYFQDFQSMTIKNEGVKDHVQDILDMFKTSACV